MRRNTEHYPDPTFDEAYANIRREEQGENYVPWVYIASPYRGDTATNILNAKRYSRYAVQQGRLPMCPHIYFTQFLDDDNETERRKGLNLALQMLKRCKEMWVFGDTVSEGMQNEIKAARRWNIPIRFFDSKQREVPGR